MALSFAGASGTLVGTGFIRIEADTAPAEEGIGALGKLPMLASAAFAGFALAAADGIKNAIDFQSAMTKIQTQAGGTAADVKTLGDQILGLGGQVQQTPQQLADAMYHLKSVGLDNADAMTALKTASDLAAVGGANLEDTTNALAGAWRSGIQGAQSFGEAAASVNAIIGAGNMSMTDFVNAIGTGILPAARSFGLSLNQVGAALALMTDEGVPATDAATRLRMSFSLLGAPSAAADKQLAKIGLSGLDLANAMRSPGGLISAIQLLKDHLDASGMSAAQQSQILSRAFGGGQSSSAILTLLNNLTTLKQKQDQVNSSMGAFGPAVQAQRQTVQAQLAMLGSAFDSLSIKVGEALLPPLVKVVSWINSSLVPALEKVASKFLAMIPVKQIEQAVKDVQSFIESLFGGSSKSAAPPMTSTQLGSLLSVTGGASAGTNLPGAGAPITSKQLGGLLGTGGGGASHFIDGVTSLVQKPKGGLLSGIDWGSIGSDIGGAIGKALMDGFDLMAVIGKWFGKVDWLSLGNKVGDQALPFIIGFTNNLFAPLFTGSFWAKHWEDVLLFLVSIIPVGRVAGLAGKLLEHIPFGEVLSPLLKGLEKSGSAVESVLGKLLKGAWAGLKALVMGMVDGLDSVFQTAVKDWIEREGPRAAKAFKGFFDNLGDTVTNQAKRLGTWIADGLLSGTEWVGKWIGKLFGEMVKGFAKSGTWLLETGRGIWTGLLAGIAGAAVGGYQWVYDNIVKPVVSWFKDLFGIHSPSTVMAEIGQDLTTGLFQGIEDIAKTASDFLMTWIFKPIAGFFFDAGKWLWNAGTSVIHGLFDGIEQVAATITGFLTTYVISPTWRAFSAAGSWLVRAGGDLISGLIGGATDALGAIGSWASKVYNSVVGAIKGIFGIKSPSTVFHGLGTNMMQGLMNGLISGQNFLDAAVQKVFSGPIDAAKALIKKGLSVVSIGGKDISSFFGSLGGDIMKLLGFSSGSGGASGTVNSWFEQAIALTKVPASWLGPLETIGQHESNFNPTAVNLVDSNAAAGHPSQGIMQTIPSTFDAYHQAGTSWNITDPVANIAAAINYIRSVYGDVSNVPGIRSLAAGGNYVGYDSGGVLPVGKSLVINNTGQPERILSPRQSQALEAGGGDVHIHFHGPVGSQRELQTWLIRSLQDAKRNGRLTGLVS